MVFVRDFVNDRLVGLVAMSQVFCDLSKVNNHEQTCRRCALSSTLGVRGANVFFLAYTIGELIMGTPCLLLFTNIWSSPHL